MTVANSLYTIIASKRMSINDAWNPHLGDPLSPYLLGKKFNYLDFTGPPFCTGLVSILNILSVPSCAYYHTPTVVVMFHAMVQCVPGLLPFISVDVCLVCFLWANEGWAQQNRKKNTHITYAHITHPWQTLVAHLFCPKFTGRNFEALRRVDVFQTNCKNCTWK